MVRGLCVCVCGQGFQCACMVRGFSVCVCLVRCFSVCAWSGVSVCVHGQGFECVCMVRCFIEARRPNCPIAAQSPAASADCVCLLRRGGGQFNGLCLCVFVRGGDSVLWPMLVCTCEGREVSFMAYA